jgi:peptidoglycan/LPS O-acetylase OafA/YrhL
VQARLGYHPALDGLRAIAIAAVVCFHAFGFPAAGYLGVDLFFVLSGFLITTLLMEEHRDRGRVSLRAFYRRRALRLLPGLFVFLAVFLAVSTLSAVLRNDFQSLDRAFLGAAAGVGYASNVLLAQHGVDALPVGISHLWSLAAEEQFYVVWPAFLFFVLRGRHRAAIALTLGATALVAIRQFQLLSAHASGDRLDFGPDTRSGSIVIGSLLALVFTSRARRRLRVSTRWVEPLAVILFVGFIFLSFGRNQYAGPLTVYAVCCAVLIVRATTDGSPLRRLLRARPLVFLGRISYSLYLWHLPILVGLGVDGDGRFAYGSPIRKLVAIGLALVAATCSYYFVELPFLRRKRGRAAAQPTSVEPVPATS